MGWKRGDIVMKAEPFAHVLLHKHRLERCSNCLLRRKTKQCGACKVLRYCSRTCQREDWQRGHDKECGCLRRVSPDVPTDSVLLLLRLVLRHQQGEDNNSSNSGDPGLRTLPDLMSHVDEMQTDPDRCDAFSKVCFTLAKLAGDSVHLPDTATLFDLFGKMVINTFTISDEELQEVGSGIYLSPSCLDHRCSPNAVATFQGRTLCIRAIDAIDGEISQVHKMAFLSYVDQLAPSWQRQQQLQQQYYFLCQCLRCKDSSLDKAMTSGTDEEEAKAAAIICEKVIEQTDKIRKNSGDGAETLRLCRACVARVKPVLPPSHVSLLRVLDRALDAAIADGQWEEALQLGLNTLSPYRRFLPAYSPALALQLMRVGKLQLFLERDRDAHASLTQAERIIAVTHGKDSDLYCQVAELLFQVALALESGPSQRAIES